MSTEKTQTFSNIVSINPYRRDFVSGSLNTLTNVTNPSYSKDQYAIAFMNTKEFISAIVGISKNIPDDDIYDALENKVYEELALDMAVEYNIKYIEALHKPSESERFFHVFITDPLALEEHFSPVIGSLKYIDQVIPVPLLLRTLYTKELIHSSGAHAFIFFQENDAFFTIYQEGEYLYSKSLKFSLKQMHERFCELLGEQIDFNTFENILETQGLNPNIPEYQKNFIKLFGEIFLHINDVITYAKRAYDIKQFEEIYIGSAVGPISGLDEYGQTYLGIRTFPFDFNFGYKTGDKKIDQIHQLMHLYVHLPAEERYECNFTIFHRPPPFAQRDSGKLIIVAAASLVIALLYPATYWTLSYIQEFRYVLMNQEYETVHIEKTQREQIINLKLANKSAAQALLDEQKTAYKQKQDTLIQVHDKKVNYPMKAKMLSDLTHSLNQYRVKLKGVNYSEDMNGTQKMFTFMLTAAKTQDITALVKHLTETKRDRYEFKMDLISYDENQTSYLSELKAVLK